MPTRARSDARRLAGRPATVGLLVDTLEDGYQLSVLRGAIDAAYAHGVHLLCFAGGVLEDDRDYVRERNGVFDLVGPSTVDAVVVMSGAIGNRIGPVGLKKFCERFGGLPLCSIAVELDSASSVSIDNEGGMRSAVDHLSRAHGIQRIAFVRGPEANEEAERRFAAYKRALEQCSIPFDPSLVVVGDFEQKGGREALRTLLEERKVPLAQLRAIVVANDAMAVGVLEELANAGVRVPDAVAVVGFDDIEESRFTSPPLTTVRQPLYEQGRDAVRMVLEQLERGAPPEHVVRQTELVNRRSCGCPLLHPAESVPASLRAARGAEQALLECRELALASVQRAGRGQLGGAGESWPERLYAAFVEQVRGESSVAFARCFEELVRALCVTDADLSIGNDVLTALRALVLPCLAGEPRRYARAEDMLHDARVATADATARVQASRRMRAERRARSVGRAAAAIASAQGLDDLSKAVSEHMPVLGIRLAYVLTFHDDEGDARRKARLAIVHAPSASSPSPPPSWQLRTPEELLHDPILAGARSCALAVLPVVFRGEELGIVVLELEAMNGYLYETLRDVFTAALAGSRGPA